MDFPVYKKDSDFSYTLGAFPSLEILQKKPSLVEHVLIHTSFVARPAAEKIIQLCTRHSIPWSQQDKVFRRLSPKENCFVIARFRKEEVNLNENAPHLVLVQPSDMGNLGSILRSALGFRFLNIAIITPAADVFDPKVVRGSMGALFSLNVQRFVDFNAYRSIYENHVFFPFMLTGATPLDTFQWPDLAHPAFIFGNESTGLPEEYSRIGTPLVIPHCKEIDSLNLSIAVSIGLYQADRLRKIHD